MTSQTVAAVPRFLLLTPGGDECLAGAISSLLRILVIRELKDEAALYLSLSKDGLALVRGTLSLRADFSDLLTRIKPNILKTELIVKAVRFRSGGYAPTVLDGTAGLGEDAFLLAASGQFVTMYESDPVIAALLRDALRRARSDTVLAPKLIISLGSPGRAERTFS